MSVVEKASVGKVLKWLNEGSENSPAGKVKTKEMRDFWATCSDEEKLEFTQVSVDEIEAREAA